MANMLDLNAINNGNGMTLADVVNRYNQTGFGSTTGSNFGGWGFNSGRTRLYGGAGDQEEYLTDPMNGGLPYIMSPENNGMYDIYDTTGKYLKSVQRMPDESFANFVVPALAALGMAYGLPTGAMLESAGITVPTAAEVGAMNIGLESALAPYAVTGGGATAGGLSAATAGQGLQAAPGAGMNLAATTGAPGMTAGTSGLGMSAGGVSTSGLAAGGGVLGAMGTGTQAASTATGLANLFKNPNDLASLGTAASGLVGYFQGQDRQAQQQAFNQQFLNQWNNLYAPGSPELDYLMKGVAAKDAAAGRNSQYGPRAAEIAGRVATAKAGAMPGMFNTATNANAAALGSGNSGLSQLFAGIGDLAKSGTLSRMFGG